MSTCPSLRLTQIWMSDPWVMWKAWHCNGKYILQCLQCFWTFTFHSQSSNGQENFMRTRSLRKYLLEFINQGSLSLSLHPSPISLSLFSLLFLSSDVDHIKIIHVTNWSSHCSCTHSKLSSSTINWCASRHWLCLQWFEGHYFGEYNICVSTLQLR